MGPTGYIHDPGERDHILAANGYPEFHVVAASTVDSGKGKTRLLYEDVRKTIGRDLKMRQQIGDCVSFGTSKAIMHRIAVQCVAGEATWPGEVATEAVYGFGRVEIGQRRLGHGDGMVGLWAVEAVSKFGMLFRKPYGSTVDLTNYSGRRATEWGWTGVPDNLEPEADDVLIVDYAKLRGWEDLRDSIYNGWPCFVCSSWLPGVRDSNGFARRDGSGGHCEAVTSMTDEGPHPGALVDGSWGAFNGPKGQFDIPDSAYWATPESIDRRIKEYDDSYAVKLFRGSPDLIPDATDWTQL